MVPIAGGGPYALDPSDWIFPSYREVAPALIRGVDPVGILHFFRGTWLSGWDPYEHNFGLYTVPVGTQPLHAVGFSLGAKLDGHLMAVLVYFGDGASSEGDVHEALNFAGVFQTPTIFLLVNNGYAISVPLARQTAAHSLAARALGYGFPGIRVDGNDVLAVYAATRDAVVRARSGHGPTLIEAVTYRMGPHSTADDPTRYRKAEELEEWRLRDPIVRFRRYLEHKGLWSEEFGAACDEEGKVLAARLRAEIVSAPPPPLESMFDCVYERPPEALLAQRDRFLSDHREDGAG
ncbi:MAG: thiamine pyrophosphate-dependent enzyme [Thermoplasmata archaeon]